MHDIRVPDNIIGIYLSTNLSIKMADLPPFLSKYMSCCSDEAVDELPILKIDYYYLPTLDWTLTLCTECLTVCLPIL